MSQASCCCGAVRGAISVSENRPQAILEATATLLRELIARNNLVPGRIVSAFFTATPDLDAEFPAHAARRLGWTEVPLLGAVEMAVPGAPPRIVRVLLTVSGLGAGQKLAPVYLNEARRLRPDLADAAAAMSTEAVVGPAAAAEPAPAPFRRLAIIGLGQIGGSIGLALRCSPWRRVGFDTDPGALEEALRREVIDEAGASLAEAVAGADIVVVAVPVDILPRVIDETADHLPKGAVLLDTGSVRGPVTPALQRAAARGISVIGGHPLAGNEIEGLAGARAELFDGSRFALLPIDENEIPAPVLDLVSDLGAEPLRVTPGEHDPILARTSHLLYLASCAVREIGAAGAARGLAGPGFRGMTRLSTSGPRMALASCRANAVHVTEAWHDLRERLDRMVASLDVA